MQKLLTTRGGTIAIGAFAAVLAAVVLVIYLNRYRDSVATEDAPVSVLVAKSLIPQGTSGDVIGTTDLFEPIDTPKAQVREGAVTDPSTLRGRTAIHDIYPGQQLTTADFSTEASGAIGLQLSGEERAIALPLDIAHGNLTNVQPGDHVDVLAGFNVQVVDQFGRPVEGGGQPRPIIKPIMQDVLVLKVPIQESGAVSGGSSNALTLQVTPEQSSQLAFASDNGTLWLVLRPRNGAPPVEPSIVTLETLILGIKPITVEKSFVKKAPGEQP